MSHITLEPGSHQFECDSNESILSAALRAGFLIPYGCKNGACGSCKGKLISGEVHLSHYQPSTLPDSERAEGQCLFCVAEPRSESITIEVREVRKAGDAPVKIRPCRIESLEKAADDVMIVRFKLPTNDRMQYLAGQYIDFLLKDGKRRSFSMANPPHADETIELHIRHTLGGLFTDRVFGASSLSSAANASGAESSALPALKARDLLRIEGPHGSFFLREESDKPIVLVASGTGFAPIKAIVEHIFYAGSDRKMTLYWGGRRPKDLYLHALAEGWANDHPEQFTYIPVISDALPEDGWTGRTGFVHQAVLDDFFELEQHQVYACGAPIVIDSARESFVNKRGLPEAEFFADSFTLAGASEG